MPLMLSRKHAIIRHYKIAAIGGKDGQGGGNGREDGGRVELSDTSTNGTCVNGARLGNNTPIVLRDGDVVTFGSAVSDVVYVFRGVPPKVSKALVRASAPSVGAIQPTKRSSGSASVLKESSGNNVENIELSNTSKNTTLKNSNKLPPPLPPAPAALFHRNNTSTSETSCEEENGEEELKFNSSFSFHGSSKTPLTSATPSTYNLKRKATEDIQQDPKLIKMHHQLFQIGEEVEAKSNKPEVPEYNAWFEGNIVNFNPENNLYTIRFKGYANFYNEQLPIERIQCPSNGDWNWTKVDVGTYVIVKHNGWWYDGIITKKLVPPKKTNFCLEVKLIDLNVEKKCKYDDVFLPLKKHVK